MHKKRIFFRSVQKYYYHVQKNCLFLGPCRNITIQGQGVPGVSCRAIFGVREKILIYRRNIHLCKNLMFYQSLMLANVQVRHLIMQLGPEGHGPQLGD